MQVNTEVYGARSTWRRDEGGFSWYNANIPEDMQFKRGQYNRLIDYVNNNKMSFGQHIDYSICYAAHGEGMPLASVRTWYTPYEGGQWKAYTYKRNKVTGWFFGHQLDSYNSYAFLIRNPKALLVDGVTNSYTNTDLWLPNGQNANYPEQQSKLIAPIVEFPTRGAYFGIEVCLYKASSASFYRRPLSDLRSGDWSEYIIVAAYGILYTYANNERDYQMNDGRCCVCPNEEYQFEREDNHQQGLSFLKYCQFNGMSSSVLPIFGWVDGGASSENFGGRNHAVKRMFWNGTDSSGNSTMFIDTVPNAVFNALDFSNWGKAIEAYCTVTSENLEAIRKAAAAYGLFFTEQNPENFRTNANRWTNNAMFCGLLDEHGVGHGEYTQGAGNRDNPVYNMGSSQNSNYTPGGGGGGDDPNQYADHTDLPSLSDVGQYYWTDKTLGSLDTKINIGNIIDVITDLADNPYNEDFIFQEPLKCVLDYRRIFLNQPWERATSSSPIVLGRFYSTDANKPFVGYADPPRYRRVTLGSWSFYRTYNNFLDFEPYTQAFLYVPYCGVKKLPMDIFSGHTVNVYMNADNCTGELQVLIFVDNIEWGTMSGMASEELPLISEEALTASNTKRQLTYQKDMIDMKSNLGVLGSLAGASISAAMHNPLGVMLQGGSALLKKVESSFEIGELNYQINHTVPDPLTIQKGNASIDKCNVRYPFVMLQTPKFINAESDGEIEALISNFGRTKGFKCCLEGTIGDFNGFTKCSNAILDGISCTYTEKTMILQALQDGVIL